MNYNIRHIILPMMTCIACAVVSCTPDLDSGALVTVSQEEMKFDVAGRGVTRTVATTNENIVDQPFMLFGDVNLGGSELKTIFERQSVAYNKKIWDYGEAKQYWFMGQEHSFVAIHPYIPRGDSLVSILTYEDNKLSFTYTLPKKMEDAKDLLFATHRRKYSLNNTGPVKFEFTHLLARINISMALIETEWMYDHVDENDAVNNPYNKNEYIKVHRIEFHGIKTRASFSFAPVALNGGNSTYDYKKSYVIRDDDEKRPVVVTLTDACIVPNSYKEGAEDLELEYVTALQDDEIVVMLPQEFDPDSDAKIVVNYSINEDKDLTRKIVIPLKNTTWEEGTVYTYKFLIDDPYYGHIKDKKIEVDIDDFRLHGEQEVGDDSWITDEDDETHNIKYGYDSKGSCGPLYNSYEN